ncbi:hypothetical protein [Methylocapsa acidiphila]|uniref:hypothetical protein n=1 Tax=Methylocapsa acidiphila TaxID=133552 RepID=UPI0012EC5D9B
MSASIFPSHQIGLDATLTKDHGHRIVNFALRYFAMRINLPLGFEQSFFLGIRHCLPDLEGPSIKLRLGRVLGLKRFRSASITIAGIELMHRIRKSQFELGHLPLKGNAAPEIRNAALAA